MQTSIKQEKAKKALEANQLTDAEKERNKQANKRTEQLHTDYNKSVDHYVKQGYPRHPDAKIKAYKDLLDMNPQPVGKEIYDLAIGIPTINDIHHDNDVIEIINQHGKLPTQEKTEKHIAKANKYRQGSHISDIFVDVGGKANTK